MLDFFKRKQKIIVPEHYENLINDKEYEIFINLCLSTLKNLDYKVLSYDNGDIVYENEKREDAHFYLDNILRKYLLSDNNEKETEIISHFTKLKDNSTAYNYLYKDFEYAKQFLKVLIKADDILPNNDDYVFQNHYPGLLTFLVFDFEDQFNYVEKSKALEWDISESEMFKIALNNIRLEEIEVSRLNFDDKYEIYALFSGDFSASYSLLAEQELDFTIGQNGSLIALPTKGSVFIFPITDEDVLDVIVTIYPTVEQIFNEEPSNISLDFYWYYQGKYEVFEKMPNDDGSVNINCPRQLVDLLNEK